MEILMNIKCSTNSSNNGASLRPTLKVVDHHHQLQQQHNPLKQRSTGPHHTHIYERPNLTITPTREPNLSPCVEYITPAVMDCCNAVTNPKAVIDLQWAQINHKRGGTCNVLGSTECPPFCEYAPCCAGVELPACCTGYSNTAHATHLAGSFPDSFSPFGSFSQQDSNTYEYHEPEENFVSIEDEKIKAFLVKVGEEQKLKESQKESLKASKETDKKDQPVVFEIIELDDVEERERLQRIRASAEQRAKEKQTLAPTTPNIPVPLLKCLSKEEKRKSPNISLIPKTPKKDIRSHESQKSKEKIIARINLLDSDSSDSDDEGRNIDRIRQENKRTNDNMDDVDYNDNNDVDEDNDDSISSRLIAAAAVSCELGCDDDNDQEGNEATQKKDVNFSSAGEQIYILHSDDEENIQFIDEQEEGLELRWDDLEDHSNSRERQLFECPVCGKKVQSNYNLRRHMMIHTGERPFGCDLCERRFREISDLKKHRRRHATEKDFVCMICRVNPPLETDSTRCNSCDTKNGTLIAAVRPDTIKTPPEIEQMFGTSLRSERKKITTTSSSNGTSSTDRTLITPPINLPPLTPISKSSCESPGNITTKAIVHSNYSPTLRAMPQFACPLCKRAFGTRHNLKRHFMIHTGEKPFSCPNCRKPFREYSTLKKHLITHRRDRWYKCLRCPQKYRDYLDYIEHKSTHGSDVSSDDGSITPKKRSKYRNDDQEDSYFTNDEDEEGDGEDDDTSTTEDCLECCECGQRFNDIEQFTEHVKEHDSNRIVYECYVCKHLFEDHKDLVEHMSVKHQTDKAEE